MTDKPEPKCKHCKDKGHYWIDWPHAKSIEQVFVVCPFCEAGKNSPYQYGQFNYFTDETDQRMSWEERRDLQGHIDNF